LNHPEQELSFCSTRVEGSATELIHGQSIMWYLYIMSNRNGRFYTGITTNLERRFKEHCQGKGGHYTSRNRPLKLLYVETFPDRKKSPGQRNTDKTLEQKEKASIDRRRF